MGKTCSMAKLSMMYAEDDKNGKSETQGRRHQKSKTGVSVAPQKGFMSSKSENFHL